MLNRFKILILIYRIMQFSPTTGSHLEFTKTTQTVEMIIPETLEYRIKNITYSHPLGLPISDMNISHGDISFSYATEYRNVVNRGADYVTLPDPYHLEKHHLTSIFDLPDVFEAVYKVENPPPSVTITFTIVGEERTVSTTTDETTGQTSTSYSKWYDKTYTWTDVVRTNLETHRQCILDAVSKSQAYKRAENNQ